MSRIQVPLEALASRLNLGSRFESVRSQSITTRFSNLKPISEFLDIKRISKPANFTEVQDRVNYNLAYFSSNYAAVAVMLVIYSLLTNLTLLFDIIFVGVGLYGIRKLAALYGTGRYLGATVYLRFAHGNSPMAGWGYRRHNSGPRLIYGQANRHSFFRGGGLDGRPRTPNDMPLWGRPSGARQGRMRNVRDKTSRRRVDVRRLREIDSDEEDEEGLGVDQSHFNDESYLTGAAPLTRLRNRRVLINDYASEHSEDEDGSDDGIGGVQLVLPDKEERLARKASERIRSAQILGLKNVMLTESEYDALENKRKRDGVARTTGAPSSLTRERPRNSVQLIEPARVQRGSVVRIRSPIPNFDNEELPRPEAATPPGILVPGSNDSLSYRPFPDSAVSPRPIYRSSRSASGSASFHSQQQNTPLHSSQFYQPEVGYPLAQGASRLSSRIQPNHLAHHVPDDHNWNSWPRSASSQTSPPHLSQERPSYAQGRRNLSGPSEINSIGYRRGNPPSMPHPSSEPSLLYRAHHAPPNSEYLTDSDNGNEEDDQRYGVKSNITPYNQNYGVTDEREGYRRDWRRRSGR